MSDGPDGAEHAQAEDKDTQDQVNIRAHSMVLVLCHELFVRIVLFRENEEHCREQKTEAAYCNSSDEAEHYFELFYLRAESALNSEQDERAHVVVYLIHVLEPGGFLLVLNSRRLRVPRDQIVGRAYQTLQVSYLVTRDKARRLRRPILCAIGSAHSVTIHSRHFLHEAGLDLGSAHSCGRAHRDVITSLIIRGVILHLRVPVGEVHLGLCFLLLSAGN